VPRERLAKAAVALAARKKQVVLGVYQMAKVSQEPKENLVSVVLEALGLCTVEAVEAADTSAAGAEVRMQIGAAAMPEAEAEDPHTRIQRS
jgi:hypothetical protein